VVNSRAASEKKGSESGEGFEDWVVMQLLHLKLGVEQALSKLGLKKKKRGGEKGTGKDSVHGGGSRSEQDDRNDRKGGESRESSIWDGGGHVKRSRG